MNKMTLTQIWNGQTKIVNTHMESYQISNLSTSKDFTDYFTVASCVNGTAQLLPEEKGSSTEIAILKYFQKMGIDYESIREIYPTKSKFPFSSARKRMSVIADFKNESHIFVKGASEMVLATCSQWYNMETNEI